MENKTLQANINERDFHVKVLPSTNESNNQQSIEDQITHMEQEMNQACGTRICGGMRSRNTRTFIPSNFQGFSNANTARI
eukprot:13973994-Ditylum_brightwellii.AAC.1